MIYGVGSGGKTYAVNGTTLCEMGGLPKQFSDLTGSQTHKISAIERDLNIFSLFPFIAEKFSAYPANPLRRGNSLFCAGDAGLVAKCAFMGTARIGNKDGNDEGSIQH